MIIDVSNDWGVSVRELHICSFDGSSSDNVSVCLDILVRIPIVGIDCHHLPAAHAHINVALLFFFDKKTAQEQATKKTMLSWTKVGNYRA